MSLVTVLFVDTKKETRIATHLLFLEPEGERGERERERKIVIITECKAVTKPTPKETFFKIHSPRTDLSIDC